MYEDQVNADDFDSMAQGVATEDEEVSAEETLDTEEATPEDQDEQMPEAETSQPPKGYVKESDLRALQSKKDQEVAEARRQAATAQQELQAQQNQLDAMVAQNERIEHELLDIRTAGMTDEEAAVERTKYEIAKEKRAVEAEKSKLASERRATTAIQNEIGKNRAAEHYSVTYKVPKDVLMQCDTEAEMQRTVKLYGNLKRTNAARTRQEAGTDRMDSGTAQGRIPSDLKQLEERFANGDETVYDALMTARKKRGIRTFGVR